MARLTVFFFSLILYLNSHSQSVDWMRNFEGGLVNIYDLQATNDDGFIIVGSFTDTVDFDLDTSSYKLVGDKKGELFLARYKSDASLVWVKPIGKATDSIWITDLLIDEHLNIYLLGGFVDSVDFDLSTSVITKHAGTVADGFLVKYNHNAAYQNLVQFIDLPPNFIKQKKSKLHIAASGIDTVKVGSTTYTNPNKLLNKGMIIDSLFSNLSFISLVNRLELSDGTPVIVSRTSKQISITVQGHWSFIIRDTFSMGLPYLDPVFISADDLVYISGSGRNYNVKTPLSNKFTYVRGSIHLGSHFAVVYDKNGVAQPRAHSSSGNHSARVKHSQYNNCPVSTVVNWSSISNFNNSSYYVTGKMLWANHPGFSLWSKVYSGPSSVYVVNQYGEPYQHVIGKDTLKFKNHNFHSSFLVKFKTGCKVSTEKFKVQVNGKIISSSSPGCGTGIDTEFRACLGDTLSFELDSTSTYQWDSLGSKKKTIIATNGQIVTGFNKLGACSYSDNGIKIKIITDPIITHDTLFICPGDSILILGYFQKNTGVYLDTTRFTTGNKCDSIIEIVNLVVIYPKPDALNQDTVYVCDTNNTGKIGIGYHWGEPRIYNKSGWTVDTLKSSLGCDSIIDTLFIQMTIPDSTKDTIHTCGPHNLLNTYTTKSVIPFTNQHGCDSIVELLKVTHKTSFSYTYNYYGSGVVNYCGTSFGLGGNIHTSNGIYSDKLKSIHGCDSILNYQLFLHSNYSLTLPSINACDSFVWAFSGKTYYSSGWYSHTKQMAPTFWGPNGCDSTIRVYVNISKSFYTPVTDTISACYGYVWPTNRKRYTTSGYYIDTVKVKSGLCDSVVALQLTISPPNQPVPDTVYTCPPHYYWNINKTNYAKSGLYVDTIRSNGCDSIISLQLFINPLQLPKTDTVVACSPFYWNKTRKNYTKSGIYRDTIRIGGCDSIVELNYTTGESVNQPVKITSCNQYTWLATGKSYNKTGTYQAKFKNSMGCDSIRTLDLIINRSTTTQLFENHCNSYTWPLTGITYTKTGQYWDTLIDQNGCDSILSLHLSLDRTPDTISNVQSCNSFYWKVNKKFYYQSGTYADTALNSKGCYAINLLNLSILPTYNDTTIVGTCKKYYDWPVTLQRIFKSGFYHRKLTSSKGCDSLVVLHLKLNQAVVDTQNIRSCWSYSWPQTGITYTTSGVYSDSIINTNGCDSVLNIQLTIDSVNAGVKQLNDTLKAMSRLASYQWLKCDTNSYTVISGATSQSFVAKTNGDYAVEVTESHCIDTSTCHNITGIGIKYNDFGNSLKVYPNPTSGKVNLVLGNDYHDVRLTIRNTLGQIVLTKSFEVASSLEAEILGENGVYFIELTTQKGKTATIRIVKE